MVACMPEWLPVMWRRWTFRLLFVAIYRIVLLLLCIALYDFLCYHCGEQRWIIYSYSYGTGSYSFIGRSEATQNWEGSITIRTGDSHPRVRNLVLSWIECDSDICQSRNTQLHRLYTRTRQFRQQHRACDCEHAWCSICIDYSAARDTTAVIWRGDMCRANIWVAIFAL